MEAWFTSLGTSLKAVHLHDNRKTSDDHLPMGEGEIDFELFFQLIKRHQVNPIYIVEPHKVEHVERSIQACRDFLRKV
jgi:sugar phosphate isomerase/epimerase